MTVNIKALLSGTETVKVLFNGEVVTIEYKPGEYTQANLEKLSAKPLGATLVMLIESWDLTVGAGARAKPLPVDEESMAILPFPFQRAMLRAIAGGATDVGEADSSSFGG